MEIGGEKGRDREREWKTAGSREYDSGGGGGPTGREKKGRMDRQRNYSRMLRSGNGAFYCAFVIVKLSGQFRVEPIYAHVSRCARDPRRAAPKWHVMLACIISQNFLRTGTGNDDERDYLRASSREPSARRESVSVGDLPVRSYLRRLCSAVHGDPKFSSPRSAARRNGNLNFYRATNPSDSVGISTMVQSLDCRPEAFGHKLEVLPCSI